MVNCSSINLPTASPVMASILRIPAATALSLTILQYPISPVAPTCVPPQNSLLYFSSAITTRTVSPYFSPNNIIAPNCCASAIGITLVTTGIFSRIFLLTINSICCNSASVIFEKCEKSKRNLSGPT